MKKMISVAALASAAALMAPSSWACPPMHNSKWVEKHFAEMDANHDGVITKKEFDSFHNQHFKTLDTNHDGKLTPAEMAAGHAEHPDHADHAEYSANHGDMLIHKRFEAADTNHDGALSREEAKATPMISQHFDEIDSNHDGLVTLAEVQAMMKGEHAVTMPAASAAVAASSPTAP